MAMASPALILRLNDLPIAARDRLVALLADHELLAIEEDDVSAPQIWTAHFVRADARDSAAAALRDATDLHEIGIQPAEIEDDDWARRTQADLPAIQIGRVIVAPPWDVPAGMRDADCGMRQAVVSVPSDTHPAPRIPHTDSDTHPAPPIPLPDIVVIIEPSRGFGTGHHQSTRLCIALLQNRNLIGQTMIDVGTGSGVLAITAAKLGAAYVAAIDVDADAIENARENIAVNGVTEVVEAHVEDFTTASRSPADVITANLTGTLLTRHAAELGRLVRSSGTLIVSGFNVEERHMVEEAFASSFAIAESAEEDDWWALVLSMSTAHVSD
jgi:ribosomal protein L11 methylase PrmA